MEEPEPWELELAAAMIHAKAMRLPELAVTACSLRRVAAYLEKLARAARAKDAPQ